LTISFIASTCARRPLEEHGVLVDHLAEEPAAEPLGGQLDGRERVLDLVGQAACHLAPGGVPLGLHEGGDVVEHDDEAAGHVPGAGQSRAGAHQDPAPDLAPQDDLFAPLVVAGLDVGTADLDELFQQRPPRRHLSQRQADGPLQVHAKDRAGSLVGGPDAHVSL